MTVKELMNEIKDRVWNIHVCQLEIKYLGFLDNWDKREVSITDEFEVSVNGNRYTMGLSEMYDALEIIESIQKGVAE